MPVTFNEVRTSENPASTPDARRLERSRLQHRQQAEQMAERGDYHRSQADNLNARFNALIIKYQSGRMMVTHVCSMCGTPAGYILKRDLRSVYRTACACRPGGDTPDEPLLWGELIKRLTNSPELLEKFLFLNA